MCIVLSAGLESGKISREFPPVIEAGSYTLRLEGKRDHLRGSFQIKQRVPSLIN